VYGLSLRSAIPLPCPAPISPGPATTEIVNGSAALFSRVRRATSIKSDGSGWFQHAGLPDGSRYLRWSGLFEFLIAPDGGRITCRPLDGVAREAFRTYLLGHVLSFALLKRGVESLHATAVVIGGETVAFLGDCGYGKSTLGAAFLQAGCSLLTDDLLVLKEQAGGFSAYPGLPRIKLFPEVAELLLGERVHGTPMNHLTPKRIIPLKRSQASRVPAPLKTIYALEPPVAASDRKQVVIRPLSARAAFLELVRNTFNPVIVDPGRLQRQFDLAARIASNVPVKSLSFPRGLARLPAVREAIESDLLA